MPPLGRSARFDQRGAARRSKPNFASAENHPACPGFLVVASIEPSAVVKPRGHRRVSRWGCSVFFGGNDARFSALRAIFRNVIFQVEMANSDRDNYDRRRLIAEFEREAWSKLEAAGVRDVSVHIFLENGKSAVELHGGTVEQQKQAAEILGIEPALKKVASSSI